MQTANTTYKIEQGYHYEGDDWWTWWIWIEANENQLNQIDEVTYTLHPTFHNPVRRIRDKKNKFRLQTEGWGTFLIYARLLLNTGEQIDLQHQLYLAYSDGTENVE